MNIAIYAEGGAGDVILAHQKAWILRETRYPDANFSIFLDTEGNKMQERVLKYIFPNFYKEIFTIPNKKYKKLVIDSQFGREEVKGFIENMPTEWFEKIMSYDKRYNFHIDSLEFLNYDDLEWSKYHKTFPRPNIVRPNNIGKYFISNVFSATGTEHKVEQFWSDRLIMDLDKLAQQKDCIHIIISTPELNSKYEHLIPKLQRTIIFNGEVEDVCDLISNSIGLVGIDSAWRLVSHMFDKSTVTISKNCRGLGGVPPSHIIRWLPFPETTFGLHHPTNEIVKLFEKMLENRVYRFLPQLALTDNSLDSILIRRKYTVNEKESIFND